MTAVLRKIEYIGGHPGATRGLTGIDVAFESGAVTFRRRREKLGSIPWTDVKALSAYSETVPAKPALGKILFPEVFGFAHGQQARRVVLSIEDERGAWLFEVPGIKLVELQEGLAKVWARHGL